MSIERTVGISAEDLERLEFLKRLDEADVEVTDWEAGFIESFVANPRGMTGAQRAAVDGMRMQYADDVK